MYGLTQRNANKRGNSEEGGIELNDFTSGEETATLLPSTNDSKETSEPNTLLTQFLHIFKHSKEKSDEDLTSNSAAGSTPKDLYAKSKTVKPFYLDENDSAKFDSMLTDFFNEFHTKFCQLKESSSNDGLLSFFFKKADSQTTITDFVAVLRAGKLSLGTSKAGSGPGIYSRFLLNRLFKDIQHIQNTKEFYAEIYFSGLFEREHFPKIMSEQLLKMCCIEVTKECYEAHNQSYTFKTPTPTDSENTESRYYISVYDVSKLILNPNDPNQFKENDLNLNDIFAAHRLAKLACSEAAKGFNPTKLNTVQQLCNHFFPELFKGNPELFNKIENKAQNTESSCFSMGMGPDMPDSNNNESLFVTTQKHIGSRR